MSFKKIEEFEGTYLTETIRKQETIILDKYIVRNLKNYQHG